MKTLVVIREKDYEWLYPVFPGVHPLLVPVCNKPYAEFLIDFAILAGSKAIRFVSDGQLGSLEEYCENGSRWGVEISYASMLGDEDLDTVIDKNRRYCSTDRILCISGFVFVRYNKQYDYKTFIASRSPGEFLRCSHGSLTLLGNKENVDYLAEQPVLSLVGLDTTGVYYRLSEEILKCGSSPYVLPGYSGESDCHIGRNVVISKSTEITKPVIIGNNVQLLAGSVIGPGSVIGSNVIIDRQSTVIGSIVLDNTYIGEHLDLENRIAAGNILIEPESGVSLAMEDPHLLTGIKKRKSGGAVFQALVHRIVAAILITFMLVPFVLLSPILRLQGKWHESSNTYYTSSSGKTLTLTTVAIERSGPLGTIALALSLDRFPLLFRVLGGQLAVIGSQPMAATPGSRMVLDRMTGYRAGVFSYAEAEEWPVNGGDTAIVELFYAAHGAPLHDIVMTFKALFNRIHE
ncbi:glycosyltransferase [Chlorobium phaeobacteroides]|uniref:Nucleoside-diphosphate-sugar pyrophosphorylase n=1 Tax=Chlorobium phaeobacteroides (strain DSM 266 / SMG 266 / 2430) TaxID=290317 RepID=A1BHG7_CHLPD|nr:NDP-sugar synthase [Chlorobium phaeobacteroides]ABL65844.1 nucleoside-diphosphate-sugar pyrophosphorylase [Chlorobium phaeobacteroides DSM 266]